MNKYMRLVTSASMASIGPAVALLFGVAIFSFCLIQRQDMVLLRGEVRSLREIVAAQEATIDEYRTVGEAAKELGADSRAISRLFGDGRLDTEVCILRGDRRMIPQTYLPRVREVLISEGKLEP